MDKKVLLGNIRRTPQKALHSIKEKQKRAYTTFREKQKKAFTTIRTKQKQAYTTIKDSIRNQMQRRKRVLIKLALMILVVALISITIGQSLFSNQKPGLYSFSIINFAGYLFFIIMPVEAAMPYYLSEGHVPLVLITVAVITALVALLINYFAGNFASNTIVNDLIGKERYLKAEKTIERYGLAAVFFFNLFPLSGDIIVLIAGMLRLKLGWVMLLSFLGLTIKYIAIAYLFSFF